MRNTETSSYAHAGKLLPLLLVAIVALGSCNKSKLKDSAQTLERSVRASCTHIRWGHWDKLAAMIRPEEGKEDEGFQQAKAQPLDDIRVINCQTLNMNAQDDLLYAVSTAEIQFHTAASINIHKLRYAQNWWKDEPTGRWYLGSNIPDFCTAMDNRHQACK